MSNYNLITTPSNLPNLLKIIPLDSVIFPGSVIPLAIDKQYAQIIEKSEEDNGYIGLFLQKHDDVIKNGNDLHNIGVVGKIVKKLITPDGGSHVLVNIFSRVERVKDLSTEPLNLVFVVKYLEDEYDKDDLETTSFVKLLISHTRKLLEGNAMLNEEMKMGLLNFDNPGKFVDRIAEMLNINPDQEQELLEILSVKERIQKVLNYTTKELEILKLQQKAQKEINKQMKSREKEFFLKEQLKVIQKELGIDDKNSDSKKFEKLISKMKIKNKDVKKQIEDELERFSMIDKNSSDYQVLRNYLDIITSLPWSDETFKKIDINKAKEQLDADHYGLNKVKDRILEFISVINRKQNYSGSIICLVGPPGVGKTSVGMSIANALGKKFYRFSVGGMRDESEIKGHRRTYVGAMPGKIIQGLKTSKTKNMVFMIDEIDKMSQSNYNGSPQSALLEVLDPEQNVSFRDNYLDLPFDISGILFILTANSLDTIDRPLLDRMEVIQLSGYIEEEKINIATNYIIPKSFRKNGAKGDEIVFESKDVLRYITTHYARESGLRNFEKNIDKIIRKSLRQIDLGESIPVKIDKEKIKEYLGIEIFKDEGIKITKPGMIFGLAYTSVGGDVLTVESILVSGKGGIKLTGKMGEVMQESANIAYSVLQSLFEEYKIDKKIIEKNLIHLHIPEGATPKDGPSAGITMASCMLSLVLNKFVPQDIAMTGELSLTGSVLPIGGLREKLMAAKRYNLKRIIIPRENERSLEDVPQNVKEGLRFFKVSNIKEVIKILFDM